MGGEPGTGGVTAPPGWRLLREGGILRLRSPEGEDLLGDFVAGREALRLRVPGPRTQPLARAVGLTRGRPVPRVLDATAGLCRDAALLAALGCRVLAVERCAALAALVEDALARLAARPLLARALGGRLLVRAAEARAVLGREGGSFDVVYLDPMYPQRKGTALARRELRLLRRLVGDDEDAPSLLAAALACGVRRVVVKRPPGAPQLAPEVRHAFRGKLARWDLYLPPPVP